MRLIAHLLIYGFHTDIIIKISCAVDERNSALCVAVDTGVQLSCKLERICKPAVVELVDMLGVAMLTIVYCLYHLACRNAVAVNLDIHIIFVVFRSYLRILIYHKSAEVEIMV